MYPIQSAVLLIPCYTKGETAAPVNLIPRATHRMKRKLGVVKQKIEGTRSRKLENSAQQCFGLRSATRRSERAAPVDWRLPCSQSRSVRVLTPSSAAKAD